MGMEVGRQAGPPGQSSEGHFRGRRPFQGGPQNGTGAPEGEEASIPARPRQLGTLTESCLGPGPGAGREVWLILGRCFLGSQGSRAQISADKPGPL